MEGIDLSKRLKIEKSSKKNKWNLLKVEDSFIDKDVLLSPHIEIFSNEKINIEGCYKVLEYTDCYLKLKLKQGQLILQGNGFDILLFERKLITVKGKISSVEFCI